MDNKLKVPRGAPLQKVIQVMAILGDIKVTQEDLNEIITIASRLEEIEQKAKEREKI